MQNNVNARVKIPMAEASLWDLRIETQQKYFEINSAEDFFLKVVFIHFVLMYP